MIESKQQATLKQIDFIMYKCMGQSTGLASGTDVQMYTTSLSRYAWEVCHGDMCAAVRKKHVDARVWRAH